ncbi:hypothetical protein LMH87_005933 [Akanthomyces muscarius]|uniref:Uncharacterized protein n=1 Tax=Akanthomyces muscarius TaxID=2231603 RepID=A0A9W8QQ64_AKAMU|nr:hypothetical protein LMH87_005933 [Akanthomyces muscarius]KAJ4164252.1 hypothetical protein LMH87_005933 [Akanthomyces muscarius]
MSVLIAQASGPDRRQSPSHAQEMAPAEGCLKEPLRHALLSSFLDDYWYRYLPLPSLPTAKRHRVPTVSKANPSAGDAAPPLNTKAQHFYRLLKSCSLRTLLLYPIISLEPFCYMFYCSV